MRTFGKGALVAAVVALAGTVGCSEDPVGAGEEVLLMSVQPQGGSVAVDPTTQVVITFDHAMMSTMAAYAALHEGAVTGPVVPGAWSLSTDGRVLTFTPAAPLKPATLHTVHLGGGMVGADGQMVDFGTHGATHMGGAWATGGMMTGGGMGGGMGGGTGDPQHMGSGWQHANGSYGMVFTFTTGG